MINKILLCDSYQQIKQIPDKSIQIIYTDVPYLYKTGGGGSSPVAKRIRANADRLQNANIDSGFNYDIFNEFIRIQPKINVFIWCSKLQIFDIANWFINYGKNNNIEIFYEILTWCKTNPTPSTNNTWLPDTEYCLYFRESGIKLNDGYNHKHKFYVTSLNTYDKNDYGHPTCKPLDIVMNHLKHVSQPNDTVFDPFVGSGTTCVAAKRLNLNYIGFEINPEFHKIATDRINGWNQKGQPNIFDL